MATMEEVAYTISESLEFACNTRNNLQQSITTGMRQLKQIQKVDNSLSSKWPNFANNAQMVLQVSKERDKIREDVFTTDMCKRSCKADVESVCTIKKNLDKLLEYTILSEKTVTTHKNKIQIM